MSKSPLVMVLRLQDLASFEMLNSHLFLKLLKNTEVVSVDDPAIARRHLTSTVRPFAVVVVDDSVAHDEYRDILHLLVDYVEYGGTVIFAGLFSMFCCDPKVDFMFKNAWRLQWRTAPIKRGSFFVNPGAPELRVDHITEKYTMKALHLRHVAAEDVIYFKNKMGKKQGKGKTPQTAATYETPIAFTRVGSGHVGFVGHKNAQHVTSHVVLAMCFHIGCVMHPAAPGVGISLPNASTLFHAKLIDILLTGYLTRCRSQTV